MRSSATTSPASSNVWSPPSGSDITSCTVSVSGVRITDAIGSSGISDSQVGIKYEDPDEPGDWLYLYGMTHVGGVQPDTSWDAIYSGTFTLTGITVSAVPSPFRVAMPMATYEDIEVYVFAYDNDGNFDYDNNNEADYRVSVDC